MTWSKEFCIGEQYNSKENLRRMYNSAYAVYNDPKRVHIRVTSQLRFT